MHKKIIKVVSKLKKKKLSLSVAESCTGGMMSQNITAISGASKIFTFGIITYSNKSKIKYLKVPFEIIKKYGSVSEECCYSMVTNLAKISGTKICIAITGIAGPNGGTKHKPVGLVFVGVKKDKKIKIVKYFFKNKSRDAIRKNSVRKSFELIDRLI